MLKPAKPADECFTTETSKCSRRRSCFVAKFDYRCNNSCEDPNVRQHQLISVSCKHNNTFITLSLAQQEHIGMHLKNMLHFKQDMSTSIHLMNSNIWLHWQKWTLHGIGLGLSWATYGTYPSWKKNLWKGSTHYDRHYKSSTHNGTTWSLTTPNMM